MPVNAQPARMIEVQCGACGSLPRASCAKCGGIGTQAKKACRRCGGTGSEAKIGGLPPKCADCRGEGWRDLDNDPIDAQDGW